MTMKVISLSLHKCYVPEVLVVDSDLFVVVAVVLIYLFCLFLSYLFIIYELLVGLV